MSQDDLLRGDIIMTLMCSMPVDISQCNQRYKIDFIHYFKKELEALQPYVHAGLILIDDLRLQITAKGRLFVRAISMEFDAHLRQKSAATYSRLI